MQANTAAANTAGIDYERIMRAIGEREPFAQVDVACAYGALVGGGGCLPRSPSRIGREGP